MMMGKVLHLWEVGDHWEICDSDDHLPLAICASRYEAIDWCEEHADELNATQICFWEQDALGPLETP